ncbi:hypothetical protein Pla110_23630 [Polystyrenella longa]|uniref:Uncharacterized protein n=1 Tax=Polystyrenella longa TaxID=2528007 RepID=A0A518CN29_9PLAN|nr:hypothetical protein Pla110_23630 [Polystyrenella longa]
MNSPISSLELEYSSDITASEIRRRKLASLLATGIRRHNSHRNLKTPSSEISSEEPANRLVISRETSLTVTSGSQTESPRE